MGERKVWSNEMTQDEHIKQLITLIKTYPTQLGSPPGIDPHQLLLAIAGVESSFGVENVPRFEKEYASGGFYFKRSKDVRMNYLRYGALACCSWSSWQILYQTAYELSYKGEPHGLWNDSEALEWVIAYLQKRIFRRGGSTLSEIADAYNSGSFQDQNVPEEYIRKFVKSYNYARVLLYG